MFAPEGSAQTGEHTPASMAVLLAGAGPAGRAGEQAGGAASHLRLHMTGGLQAATCAGSCSRLSAALLPGCSLPGSLVGLRGASTRDLTDEARPLSPQNCESPPVGPSARPAYLQSCPVVENTCVYMATHAHKHTHVHTRTQRPS